MYIMKKLIILFMLTGLVLSISSCKKEEKTCPEPEGPWAIGTWKATKIVDQGQELPSSVPEVACMLENTIILNESGSGNWDYHEYNNNNCVSFPLVIEYWLENKAKKKLLVHFTANNSTYNIPFEYVDAKHFRYIEGTDSYAEFTKQ